MNKDVIGCTEKYVAFISSKLAEKWMQDLKRLEIAFCHALQIIFLFEENHVIARAFDSLIELKLFGLQSLERIWFQVPPGIIAFQNLQLLVLSECHNLYLFSPGVAKLMVQLQKIYINHCEKMEEVIAKENEGESKEKIVFPRLKLLELEHNTNLKFFCGGIHVTELPFSESLKINQCSKMDCFSYKSTRTPVLKRILINGRLCVLMGDLNTTIKRYTKDCFGTPADDDNPSSTINIYSLDELHSKPNELDGYDVLDWLNETAVSEANEDANQSYMKEFSFADLEIATNNFSSDALLGKGGFGEVYKGWLDERTFSPSKTRTGMAVAIKKLSSKSYQGFEEWLSEAYFLERQWHPNLIKLVGYCGEDEELFLAYEFMARGSLDYHLFRRNLGIYSFSWKMRLKVAVGAAHGLAFLHSLEKKVIHRDFNPSNILLDGNYNARISDFGSAKFGPLGGYPHVTTRVTGTHRYPAPEYIQSGGDSNVTTRAMGTYGYASPEYIVTGHLYVKSVVYGFGIVLLELMTGLRSIDRNRPSGQQDLVEWVRPALSNERKLKKIVDKRIEGQYSSKAMMLAAQLALKCIESSIYE